MRIALGTEYYYPHLGGVTEHVHNLALELQRRGHDVTVLTSNMRGQGEDPAFVSRVGTSHIFYRSGNFSRFTTGWALTRSVQDLLAEKRIDVVHVHDVLAPTLGLVASSAAWKLGLPVVATSHTWFDRALAYKCLQPLLQRRLDRVAARIAVSRPVVEAMSMYFRGDWEIIPNGVDTSFFHPGERYAGGDLSLGATLLFLGRLDPRNGLETVIKAMPEVLARHPGTRLVVAGDGPLRGHYERQAARLGSSVQFVGQVNGERPACYSEADIYLCPTTKASFGVTLLEAMACGTPIVASDITGFRELIDGGEEAMMVPKDDPSAWARTIVSLIEDPCRRESMSAAGLAKAPRFDWSVVAEQILSVYSRVLQ